MVQPRLSTIQRHLDGIESFRQRALEHGDEHRAARAEQGLVQLEQQLAGMQDRLERDADQERQRRQREQDHADARPRQHVFVVNGDPDFLNMMRSLLQDERFTVTTTNYVPRTFDQIATLQPALLLVHLATGERAGWEVLRRMQQEALTRAIPVVVTSHEADLLARAVAEQERHGSGRFRAVPLDYHQIMAAIEQLVGTA